MVSRTSFPTRKMAWGILVVLAIPMAGLAQGAEPAMPAAPAAPAAAAPAPASAPAPDANAAAPAPAAPASAPAEPPAGGALAGEKPREEKLALLWDNLLHFIRMAQPDAARSFGKSILDMQPAPQPVEIYHLTIAKPDSLAELARARSIEGLKAMATELLRLSDEGYRAERSAPEQIRTSIELLSGNLRQFIRGRDRLLISGEYAVPALLRTLEDPKTTMMLRERIMTVLPQLGKPAVLPLAAALQMPDPHLQQIIANALGRLEYSHALPRLKEMYDRKDLQEGTRRIVRAALIACNGGDEAVLKKPVAQLYYDLALSFYYRAQSLVPDERYPMANVWQWDRDLAGLVYKPVPREIFCDVYAMRMARLSLGHDPKFYPAVSLWLAAGLKREADLPAGKTDPLRQATDPPAEFYMLAAGAKYQQDVLARSLRDKDWAVATGAIEALGRTAGAESLVEPVAGGAQPLVEALSCASRKVRYWAAASLATALPTRRFTGNELVLPILNEALRQTGKKTALIIAAEQERRNTLKDAARAAGYEVVDDSEPARGLTAAREAGGAEVAVLAADPDPMAAMLMIRQDPLMATMPVVIASQTERFQTLAKGDSRVRLVAPNAAAAEVGQAIGEVVQVAGGAPLTAEEAGQWAVRAARAIRLLGMTRNAVYDIARCRGTLIAALGDGRAEVKTAAAEALATIPGPQAQQAVAALGIDAAQAEPVRLAALRALVEAVRRFGGALGDKQSGAIIDIVIKSSGELKMAAAEALGSLNLPSDEIKELILTANGGRQ